MKLKRIVITSDLLRVTGRETSRKGFATNTDFFAALLSPQISAATRLPISILEWDDTSAFSGMPVYDACGLEPNVNGWARLFAADATPALSAIFLPYVEGALVIGFEISPLLQNILNALDIPFVDLRWHPLRFLDDIFFGLASNRPAISTAIDRYALAAQEVDFHVGLHRATAIRRSAFRQNEPAYGTLLVGQTPFDASLIHDGRIAKWLDHQDEIADLTKDGPAAFRPHPFSKQIAPEFAGFLKDHRIEVIDGDTDMYAVLSDPSLNRIVSLSSGTLEEAAFFGVPATRLIPQQFHYLPEPSGEDTRDEKLLTYTGIYHAFLDVDFWANILEPELGKTWRNGKPIPLKPDRLRHVNGSFWGYLGTGGTNLVMPYNTPE